jgi:hypothetical protein
MPRKKKIKAQALSNLEPVPEKKKKSWRRLIPAFGGNMRLTRSPPPKIPEEATLFGLKIWKKE